MRGYYSKHINTAAITCYFLSLLAVSLAFMQYTMPWYTILMGILSLLAFWYYAWRLPIRYERLSEKRFEHRMFWTIVVVYCAWALFYCGITTLLWNTPWEQPSWCSKDSAAYFETGKWLADCIRNGDVTPWFDWAFKENGVSDLGYPLVLAVLDLLSWDSIIFTRFANAFFAAWMVVLLYRLAKRNFGEKVGRLSAIFTFLMPSLIFWTATTMKEAVMTMFTVWYLERVDFVFRKPKLLIKDYAEIILFSSFLMWFRTALFAVAILTFVVAIVITDKKIISTGRKIALGLFLSFCMLVVFSGEVSQLVNELLVNREQAKGNLEFRANREGGNSLAQYLSAVAMAPLVFTIPFPTMIDLYYQPTQAMLNGGWFIKNIMSFFLLYALIVLVRSGEWKQHIIVLAYMLGYMAALALSSYIHAGRFHYPVLPFDMMLAAYGIVHFKKKHFKYFNLFLCFEFAVIIVWNWFKLKGRGLV